ncbi:MAG TPA: ATP-binding protein [Minicystis sp.]|nr:ATP-binding protein [Minicystis sp.]
MSPHVCAASIPRVHDPGGDEAPGELPTSAFLAAVIDAVGHPIFVKDRAYRFVLVNPALSAMVGYPREAFVGKTDFDFFPRGEAEFFRDVDRRVFATGESVTTEEPITDASGARHELATTKVPLRSAGDGAITHVVGIVHDVTRQKQAEEALRLANEELERRVRERTAALSSAQAELVRTERLAVLGQLAGGLAHQIRNPLGSITNAAYVVQRELARHPNADAARAVAIILEEVWQANRIITDLLDYARVRLPERRAVDLAVLADQAVAAADVPPSVRVEREVAGVPRVSVDPDQVRDALVNLVRNAVEAMPEGGALRVSARSEGDQVAVEIADTGPGIPRDVREKLFEPLVTTKPLGLGLGLTTARALIQNQGGTIACESGEPRGTRFVVRLPVEAS